MFIRQVATKEVYEVRMAKLKSDPEFCGSIVKSTKDIAKIIRENADHIAMQIALFGIHALTTKGNKVQGIVPHDVFIATSKPPLREGHRPEKVAAKEARRTIPEVPKTRLEAGRDQ